MNITKKLCAFAMLWIAGSAMLQAQVRVEQFRAGNLQLTIEVLDDDLIHLQYKKGNQPIEKIPHSPMIYKTEFSGVRMYNKLPSGIETSDIRLEIDPANLQVRFRDKTKNNTELSVFSPLMRNDTLRGLRASAGADYHAYGLGQQFTEVNSTNISWKGRKRAGNEFGNIMAGFNRGANGNTQIPILYVLNGASFENYALFFDNTYRHEWDFTNKEFWTVQASEGDINFYLMSGPNMADLRKDYMELTGHPPIPPKKMFGLWVSEYGYDDWQELESKLSTMRKNNFPLDGFVLDLQWFGNIVPESEDSKIGRLAWDLSKFPNPAQKIKQLREQQGVGIMLIEETYVGKNMPEYQEYKQAGILVRDGKDSTNFHILKDTWWGSGGMIDYTNPEAGKYIHDKKRMALIKDGVLGHWTDLGEPENFNPTARYHGGRHKDIHNLYNFYWIKSIYEGYKRNNVERRPFIMSRSGAAGIQRFGAAMWSGDISSRLSSLKPHAANQANMSFSGIDFYGADIGGFHRHLDSAATMDDLYTRWYAYGMIFDIPGRPHTFNIDSNVNQETAPDRIGDVKSNLYNTRLRYSLIPYTYSLAYQAYRNAEPVMPPLVYHYQSDPQVLNIGDVKMYGPYLLAAMITEYKSTQRDVYLPKGNWFDYHTNQLVSSKGETFRDVPIVQNGITRLPLFAKEGAIIPMAYVDEQTLNALGRRKGNKERNELHVKVFAGPEATTFTLYEDDGITVNYLEGAHRTTNLQQQRSNNRATVTIQAVEGNYKMDEQRQNIVHLISSGPTKQVNVNGKKLKKINSEAAFQRADAGWFQQGDVTLIKTGVMGVKTAKQVEATF